MALPQSSVFRGLARSAHRRRTIRVRTSDSTCRNHRHARDPSTRSRRQAYAIHVVENEQRLWLEDNFYHVYNPNLLNTGKKTNFYIATDKTVAKALTGRQTFLISRP